MAQEFKLPELGENVESADIVSVLVSEGETISENQSVLEVETDKATLEVPSTVSGKIEQLNVKAGDSVAVGQPILTVSPSQGEGGGAQQGAQASADVETPSEPTTTADQTPSEGTQPVEQKAEQRVERAEAQRPDKQQAQPTPPQPQEPAKAGAPGAERGQRIPVAAAPSVRRFAREIGVDLTRVPGSGPGGRISTEDVKRFARGVNGQQAGKGGGGAVSGAQPLPDFSKQGPTRRESMNNIRRKTVEHMVRSWTTIPHVILEAKADVTDLENLRQKYKPRVQKEGARLTLTAMLLKLTVSALKAFPKLNASVDIQREEVVYKDYYNVGVAVDTPKGLVVPVIRDADTKNMTELAVELGQVSERARAGRLTPDDFTGGTFTLTNLGALGVGHFTPIINYPEVAILGVGRAQWTPIYEDGQFQPRLMMPLSAGVDHRLVDGADGARFLQRIVDSVQEPLLVALEG